MIALTDSRPLSPAKSTFFHQQPRLCRQIYHSVKVHANEEIPCINYYFLPVTLTLDPLLLPLTLTLDPLPLPLTLTLDPYPRPAF